MNAAIRSSRLALLVFSCLFHTIIVKPLIAQDSPPTTVADAPGETGDAADNVAAKPTELGLRFTPQLSRAMSRRFTESMQPRYDLTDVQVKDIQAVFDRRLLEFAHENERLSRDMIEFMLPVMIEHDGEMPRVEAMRFAEFAEPFSNKLQGMFTEIAGEVGEKMSFGQRLKYSADMAAASAGLAMFKSRMKKWREGDVKDGANPFFDRPETATSQPAESPPADPSEHPTHRRAREDVERWTMREINLDSEWEEYLRDTSAYYKFEEKQVTAGEAILKECSERSRNIKNDVMLTAAKQNRMAKRLTRMLGSRDENTMPWIYRLDREYEQMLKPLRDLDDEFKRRLDELPTSTQRATANAAVREKLEKVGLAMPN